MTTKPGHYTHVGKQVLLDGKHFADCATVTGAEMIVAAMSAQPEKPGTRDQIIRYIEQRAEQRATPAIRRTLQIVADNIRAKFDEDAPDA